MTDRKIILSYIPMARFIASICGPSCEVVIHDLSDIAHSIVFIANGELTGRKIGDGLIDFTITDSFDSENRREDFSSNIISGGTTFRGDKMRCSSYFIRNRTGKIIGFLGVSQDLTELCSVRDRLDALFNIPSDTVIGGAGAADRAISAESMVDRSITEALRETGKQDVSDLTREERMRIIGILEEKNIFIIKGCVNLVAEKINVSAPTIYRYINESRGNG